MKIKVRKATKEDFSAILEVEKKSYHPLLQATKEILYWRFEVFGIWVAEVKGRVVGFFTCVPVYLEWPKPNFKRILKNRHPKYKPWYLEYQRGGKFNTLFVISTAVMSDYQNKGIGTAMVKHSLKLAKQMKLKYRASALRCQYVQYYKKTNKPITVFIKEAQAGKIKDRFLAPYLKLGFTLSKPLKNYEPYKGSMNWNIFAYKKII